MAASWLGLKKLRASSFTYEGEDEPACQREAGLRVRLAGRSLLWPCPCVPNLSSLLLVFCSAFLRPFMGGEWGVGRYRRCVAI